MDKISSPMPGSLLGLGLGMKAVAFFREKDLEGEAAFYAAHFTPAEMAMALKFRTKEERFAARFAAKEAFLSAAQAAGYIGPFAMTDIEITGGGDTAPTLAQSPASTNEALRNFLQNIQVAISITHETDLAAAIVTLSGWAAAACRHVAVLHKAGG